MAGISFKTINTQDKNLQLIQDNVAAAIAPIQRSPLIGGVLLLNVSLKAGQDNLVQHTLNRMPQIIIPGIPSVNTTIWSPASSSIGNQSSNSQYVNLCCSSNCTVSVWVN